MGSIGTGVAQRAKAFGMVLHYHNRSRLPVDREFGGLYHPSLDDLMAVSDVLCICAPSTPELKGSVDARCLNLLPPGALVVNVARGDLIDEEALFKAIAEGQIGGVASDVFRNEPKIDPRWLQLPNATLLPHIGSATLEVRIAMGMLVLDGIKAHFEGRAKGHCVNAKVYDGATSKTMRATVEVER